MSDWNPALYLRFEAQRTQPAVDLANRLRPYRPRTVADLGCGPGNSTAVLRAALPEAELTGIDSSPSMIEAARAKHPDLLFRQGDVAALDGEYDALFSNACLQWLPHHETLLPALLERLRPGGVLAVQIPSNGEEPLFRIIREVADEPQWGLRDLPVTPNGVLTPDAYFDLLSAHARRFDLWETVYCHALPSHAALVDWVRSTRLRPYLAALDEEAAAAFVQEIERRAASAYPVHPNGDVLLRFRRLFFLAER